MPDLSFKVWHLALRCDHPAHPRDKLRHPDSEQRSEDADYYSVEPEATRESYRADLRYDGWVFHRDGRVTCPKCNAIAAAARKSGDVKQAPGEAPQSGHDSGIAHD